MTVATPFASVVPAVALRFALVQTAPGEPVAANVTASPETAAPVTPFVTVALIVEVLVPLAGRLAGVAVAVKPFGTAVWVIVVGLVPVDGAELFEIASVALTAHAPAVVDAV